MSESQRIDYAPMPEVSKITLDAGATTKASEKHPDRNEDTCLVNLSNRTFGIFDGMGGIANGKDAADISSKVFQSGLSFIDTNHTSPPVIQEKLNAIFNQANKFVLEQQKVIGSNMGSTATVATIISSEPGEYQLCAIHVGDSRIYVLRDGVLKRVTTDHNIIYQEDPQNYDYHQNILDNFDGTQSLTLIQKTFYQGRSGISRFIGNPTSKPDFYNIKLKSGDVVLFTSDGVHDNLTTSEISSIITGNKKKDASFIAQELIERSVRRSKDKSLRSKKDDMTALVIRVNSPDSNSKSESNSEKQSTYLPKVGDKINVERSSGIIEPGWNVFYIDQDKGRLLVTKKDPETGQLIRKKIKIELAQRLNTPAKSEHISQAETLPQLFHTLRGIGGIQGSSEFFPSNYLIEIIQAVKSGRKNVNTITRTYGLRDTVQKLIEKGK